MTKQKWKKVIVEACKKAGTYQEYFESVINTLAQIMEARDITHIQYVEDGCRSTVIRTTDRSREKNIVKNPILVMENELNAQALAYWRDLGLTPAGFKKLDGLVKMEAVGALESLIESLSEE